MQQVRFQITTPSQNSGVSYSHNKTSVEIFLTYLVAVIKPAVNENRAIKSFIFEADPLTWTVLLLHSCNGSRMPNKRVFWKFIRNTDAKDIAQECGEHLWTKVLILWHLLKLTEAEKSSLTDPLKYFVDNASVISNV